MNTNELLPGSKVYRTKGAVRHVGIMLMGARVLHITPAKDVEVTDLKGFGGGSKVSFNLPPAGIDMRAIEKRAEEILTKGPCYRWWAFNCEHLASYVQTGQKMSSQLRAGLAGAAVHLTMSKKRSITGVVLSAFGGLIVERAMHASKKIPESHATITY